MHRALVAGLLIGLASPARAQMPDTPAGRQLAGWLEAFNSERHEPLTQFVEKNVAEPSRKQLLAASPQTFDFRERTGGFVFRKAEESTPTRLSALVQERVSDRIARFVMEVEADAPHRITKLSANLVPTPPDLAVKRMSETELVAALRDKLTEDAQRGKFSGAVLLARDGRTLFEGAYGLADREKHVAYALDTRFRIGSMNKMFTAVAVLQLVQAGKIRLDAPLGTYLTDYPNKDAASTTT